MEEATPETETAAMLVKDFPELEKALTEAGIDLQDKNIADAVLLTAKVFPIT